MGQREVESFLTMLATERRISVSTHHQALGALLFLHPKVPAVQMPWPDDLQRPNRPRRISAVMTVVGISAVPGQLHDEVGLLVRLLVRLLARLLVRLLARLLYRTLCAVLGGGTAARSRAV